MRPGSIAGAKPTCRRCWRQMRPGTRPMPACRPMAALPLPKSTTSSASSARRGSIRWRRSRPIWCCRILPSIFSACPAPTEGLSMLPLEGVTVVAVEQAVAAPFCSTRLADAGATVIKVERPEGDFARDYDANIKGQSSYFVWLNRGKKSVCIDLASEEGRAQLERLIAKADVLLQNR